MVPWVERSGYRLRLGLAAATRQSDPRFALKLSSFSRGEEGGFGREPTPNVVEGELGERRREI